MDFTDMTDAQVDELLDAAYAESQRRAALRAAPAAIEEAVAAWREAAGRQDGDDYVEPTGYHDAYPRDAIVTRDGRRWRSTRGGATGVPGGSPDWREIAEEGQILPWVQPHAGSKYPVGAIVTHQGRTWRNDLGRPNGWRPGQTGASWTDIGLA